MDRSQLERILLSEKDWSTFVIILAETNQEAVKVKIANTYHDYCRIADNCFLISSTEISDEVATSIGLKGTNRIEGANGIVFKLNGSYSGYSYRTIWDWMDRAEARREGRG